RPGSRAAAASPRRRRATHRCSGCAPARSSGCRGRGRRPASGHWRPRRTPSCRDPGHCKPATPAWRRDPRNRSFPAPGCGTGGIHRAVRSARLRASPAESRMAAHSQFALLTQRRFLPYLIVQALGAFNDNVYRQAIIGLLFFLGVSAEERSTYAVIAPAIFIVPYFLFSAIAGQVAEKLEKQRLIVITTTMEIAIMSLAAVGFPLQSMPLLLVALFCTGLQSTLFGPVKYSVLPAILKPEELTGGNGLVEMGTSISILGGMITGGLIFQLAGAHGPEAAAAAIVALAIAGNLVARLIPRVDAGAPDLKIGWNPLPESLAVLRMARAQPAVRNAILGVSWFWFFGTIVTSQLPAYAELNLGGASGSATLYIFVLALFSVGTGTGSLLCEKLSARTVEIGLVPLGAAGMSAFLL